MQRSCEKLKHIKVRPDLNEIDRIHVQMGNMENRPSRKSSEGCGASEGCRPSSEFRGQWQHLIQDILDSSYLSFLVTQLSIVAMPGVRVYMCETFASLLWFRPFQRPVPEGGWDKCTGSPSLLSECRQETHRLTSNRRLKAGGY